MKKISPLYAWWYLYGPSWRTMISLLVMAIGLFSYFAHNLGLLIAAYLSFAWLNWNSIDNLFKP